MNQIKFNDFQCEVISFNKYTNFDQNGMSGNCSCQIVTDNLSGLQELGQQGITSMQIFHDEALIYNLENIEAHLTYINESLNNDHIDITLSINF